MLDPFFGSGEFWEAGLFVLEKSFWIATIDESNKGKLHAVPQQGLNRVAALLSSVARDCEAVVFLLAGPGLAILRRGG